MKMYIDFSETMVKYFRPIFIQFKSGDLSQNFSL